MKIPVNRPRAHHFRFPPCFMAELYHSRFRTQRDDEPQHRVHPNRPLAEALPTINEALTQAAQEPVSVALLKPFIGHRLPTRGSRETHACASRMADAMAGRLFSLQRHDRAIRSMPTATQSRRLQKPTASSDK